MDSLLNRVGDCVWLQRGEGGTLAEGGRYFSREEGVACSVGSQDGRNNREGFRGKKVKE